MPLALVVRPGAAELRARAAQNLQLVSRSGVVTRDQALLHQDGAGPLELARAGGLLPPGWGVHQGQGMRDAAGRAMRAPRLSIVSNRHERIWTYDEFFRYHPLSHLDAAENWFFQRELEHIIPTMFQREFAKINARTVLPLYFAADPTAERITWRMTTSYGEARVMNDYAADAPTAEVEGAESHQPVRPIRIAAEWTIDEIRKSRRVGRPIDAAKAEAARDAMLRTENRIAWRGDAAHGLVGLNNDAATLITVQAATGAWAGLTADQRLADLHSVVHGVVTNSGEVEEPDTLLMPTGAYHLTVTQRIGTDTHMTTMMHFMAATPYIRSIIRVRELTGIGTGSANRILVFKRDLSKLRFNVVVDLEQWPAEIRNGVTRVNYHMKTAGVTVHKPRSARWLEGV